MCGEYKPQQTNSMLKSQLVQFCHCCWTGYTNATLQIDIHDKANFLLYGIISLLLLLYNAGIAFLTNSRVTAADLASKTLTLASGDVITYQQLVIATGADVSKQHMAGSTAPP
jgi:hypothetical protein